MIWLAATVAAAVVAVLLPATARTAARNGPITLAWTNGLYAVNDGVAKLLFTPPEPMGLAEPAWSPDGRYLAWIGGTDWVERDNGEGGWRDNGIWSLDTKTGSIREVISDDLAQSPSWSPDDSKLVYLGADGIRTVNRDGSDAVTIVAGPYVNTVAWSPTADRIVFDEFTEDPMFDPRPPTRLYTANADGTDVTAITDPLPYDPVPAWSPDGRRLAYVSNGELVVSTADGSDPHVLARAYGARPAWSPDGSEILYSGLGVMELDVVPANGGQPAVVSARDARGYSMWDPWPAWQPVDFARIAPVVVDRPRISGPASAGSTLSAATGTWNGDQPLTYAYQWQRCDRAGGGCLAIAGATASTYTVGQADVLATLRVAVTATNAAGSATSGSDATGVVPAPAVRTPPTTAMAPLIRSAHATRAGASVRLRLSVCSSQGGTLYVTEWNRSGTKATDKQRRSWSVAPTATCHIVTRTWRPRLRPGKAHVLALRLRAGTLWSPAVRLTLRVPAR